MDREPEQITDEWLVLCVQAGSSEAMQSLIRRWQPKLIAHACQITGKADAASDIVQEAWLSILRSIGRLQDPAAFRGWAYRIVHFRAVDWLRQRKRQCDAIEQLSLTQTTIERQYSADSTENRQRLTEAINRLEPEQKLLVRMYYVDGMRVHEISSALEVPSGTIKYRLFQLRKTLKEIIEKDL